MGTLAQAIDGLETTLKTINGLRVYDFPAAQIQPPCAVLSNPETGYDITLGGGSYQWAFPLWLIVSQADDRASYSEIYPYLESDGTKSIRATIEADRTLGGTCDTVAVTNARVQLASVGGTEFLAIEFTLEVIT